ncbi:hypothetical protein TorRG33x02_108400 [Trema orientale]|uniref:Uncharacterized protein n=1 Tax=Trema orientale TaxID=63057 RepID=A0A2P5F673_TREOI|nr:hypothetical protein TorRG33x02_108400 [Trema orientale]
MWCFQDQMALKETLIRMATKLNIAPEPLYREELTYPPELVMDANFILLLNSKYNSLGNKTKTTLTEWDNQSSVEGEVVYKNGLTARPR